MTMSEYTVLDALESKRHMESEIRAMLNLYADKYGLFVTHISLVHDHKLGQRVPRVESVSIAAEL